MKYVDTFGKYTLRLKIAQSVTSSVEQSISYEADSHSSSLRLLWEPKGSSPYSQEPASESYPELVQSSTSLHTLFY
jgi:hypothetical protein